MHGNTTSASGRHLATISTFGLSFYGKTVGFMSETIRKHFKETMAEHSNDTHKFIYL